MPSSRKLKAVAVYLMWMDSYTMECILTEELECLESDPDPSSDESPDRPTQYIEMALAEPEDEPSVADIFLPSPNSSLYTAENWLFRRMKRPASDSSGQQSHPAETTSPSSMTSPTAAAASTGNLAPPPSPASGSNAGPSPADQGESNQSAAAVASGNAQESSKTGRGRLAQIRRRFAKWVSLAWLSVRRG